MSKRTTEVPGSPLKFLLFTTRPFLPWLVIGLSFHVAVQLVNTYISYFIGSFADVTTTFTEAAQFGKWAIMYVVLMAISFSLFRLTGFTAIRLVLKQNKYAFIKIKEYLLNHSHKYFIDRFAGSVTSKVFHVGDRSGELLLMCYYGAVRLLVSFVSTGVIISIFSVWLGLIYFVILFFTIFLNYFLVQRRRPHVVEFANMSSKYRGQITDVITNIQAVMQYARLNHEFKWLGDNLEERIQKDSKQWRMAEWNHVINNVMALFLLVVMIGGMYYLLVHDLATIGAFITVMILMYRVAGVILDLGDWMNRFIRVYGEVEEGLEDIVVPHEVNDAPYAEELQVNAGEIMWNNVSFTFEKQPVFDNFSLLIKSGQRIGLVGHSGAGKTTFVSLLLRQYDLQGGAIQIDGQNIAEVTQESLRANIAIVPQEPLLFHRTIYENILYGNPEATKAEVIEAAKKAQAHDFISELPDGYETLVGERGIKLSGGQKQRVAIARAILKDAPILVLDEATSALDSESEVAIQKALEKLMENRTVIAVAHRLSTLRKMDRIILLENGEIKEDGTHEELSQSGGVYQRLWEHQAGGFLSE